MSDAEWPGRRSQRLDWGEGSDPTGEAHPDPDAVDTDGLDDIDGPDDTDDASLCVIEDPTCDACQ